MHNELNNEPMDVFFVSKRIYSRQTVYWGGLFVVVWAHRAAKHHRKTIILLDDPNQKQRNPFRRLLELDVT